jgi:outer membrane protein assembly factor BamB
MTKHARMRKALPALFTLLLILGCGGSEEPAPDAGSSGAGATPATKSAAPTAPAANEKPSDNGPALIPPGGTDKGETQDSGETNQQPQAADRPEPSAALRSAVAAAAGNWPQWRGPNRDGVSTETGLLTHWPDEGLPVLWKVPGGEGYSCIAISDGRLYTMVDRGDTEWVLCLDAGTGQELWKVPTAKSYTNGQGNGPRSTPTIDGPRVYCLGATGALWCLDKETGSEIWRANILDDFSAENLTWGVSTSPLVEGDMLLVMVGAPGASVVAFNKNNGNVVWQAHDDVASYSSPIAITVDGVREIVFYAGKALFGMSPADGAVHWRLEWLTTSDMNIATPIYDSATQLLFVSASRDTGRCSAYRLSSSSGGTVTAEHVYTNKNMKNHFNGCVLVDGYLYGFDTGRSDALKCIRLEDGEQMWEDPSVGKGSLVYAQGLLFLVGENGAVALAEATPEGYREHGRMDLLQHKAWTPPVLAGGKLYVRDEHDIVCLDARAP